MSGFLHPLPHRVPPEEILNLKPEGHELGAGSFMFTLTPLSTCVTVGELQNSVPHPQWKQWTTIKQ